MKSGEFCKILEEEMLPKLESPSIIVMDKQSTLMWKSTRKPIHIYCELVVSAWSEFQ